MDSNQNVNERAVCLKRVCCSSVTLHPMLFALCWIAFECLHCFVVESVECERMNSIACLFRGLLILLVVFFFCCCSFFPFIRYNLDYYGLMPFSSHAQHIGNSILSVHYSVLHSLCTEPIRNIQ